jgi:hypothetical protein
MSSFTAWMVEKLTPLAIAVLFEAIDIWEGED